MYNGACYKLSNSTKKAWLEAVQTCNAEGAHLVSINSAAENHFVHSIVTYMDGDMQRGWSWIGFNNMTADARFVWSDGSPNNYTNWSWGKPNEGDCAYMGPSGKWNDIACRLELPITCKYKS